MKQLIVLLGFLLVSTAALAQEATYNPTLPDLAERLLPSVVNIASSQKVDETQQAPQAMPFPDFPKFPEGSPFNDLFDELQKQYAYPHGGGATPMLPPTALGSGFVVNVEKGLIITNNHVVSGADDIKVTLHDDTVIPAKLLGSDEKTDIALLQADLKGQKVVQAPLGNSDAVRVGESIFAIGNPFGLGGTVTAGIISARARDINSGPYDDFLQTDASINRGNSGGPLFNMKGEVIGINSAIFSPTGGSVGIGFAIPSNLAKSVMAQLEKYGKTRRGWLGVKIQTVTPEIAKSLGMEKTQGALVASISKDSPAAKAGIKTGDVILKFNGQDIREMRQLPRLVAEAQIGGTAEVEYWHAGKIKTVSVDLDELEKAEKMGLLDDKKTKEKTQQKTSASNKLGLALAPLNAELRARYSIAPDVEGMVVTSINPASDSARKGVQVGDVVVEINQTPALNMDAVNAQISAVEAQKSDTVLLLLNRAGDIQFVGVRFAAK